MTTTQEAPPKKPTPSKTPELTQFNALEREEQHALIHSELLKNATQEYSDDPRKQPLFNRFKIAENKELQDAIIELSGAYVDMILMREDNIVSRDEAGHKEFANRQLDQRIAAEMGVWFNHVQTSLEQFEQIENEEVAEKVTGAIVALSIATACQIGGFERARLVESGNMDMAAINYARSANPPLEEKETLDKVPPEKKKLAKNILTGHLEMLKNKYSRSEKESPER